VEYFFVSHFCNFRYGYLVDGNIIFRSTSCEGITHDSEAEVLGHNIFCVFVIKRLVFLTNEYLIINSQTDDAIMIISYQLFELLNCHVSCLIPEKILPNDLRPILQMTVY